MSEGSTEETIFVDPNSWLPEFYGQGAEPLFPDITLRVGEEWSMKAHRGVLVASVPYFKQAYTQGWAEFQAGEMKFDGKFDTESFQAVISSASYGQELNITEANVCKVHEIANFLALEDRIARKCVNFMRGKVNTDTMLLYWLYAQKEFPGSKSLLRACERSLVTHFPYISSKNVPKSLTWRQLGSLLSIEELKETIEAELVLDVCFRWINEDWPNRCQFADEIIEVIDWSSIDFSVCNTFKSVDVIRERVCETDAEKYADHQLSKMLLLSSKPKPGGSDDFQDYEGCGISLAIQPAGDTVGCARVGGTKHVRVELNVFRSTETGPWIASKSGTTATLRGIKSQNEGNTHMIFLGLISFTGGKSYMSLVHSRQKKGDDSKLVLAYYLDGRYADYDLVACQKVLSADIKAAYCDGKLCLVSFDPSGAKQIENLAIYSIKDGNAESGPPRSCETDPVYTFDFRSLDPTFKIAGCGVGAVRGKLVLLGGFEPSPKSSDFPYHYSKALWIMDLKTFTTVKRPNSFPYSVERPSVTSHDSYLFVSGGRRENGDTRTTLSDAFCYNADTGVWTRLPSMSGPREGHCLVVVRDRLVAIGGTSQGCKVNFAEELCLTKLDEGWQRVDLFGDLQPDFVSSA